MHFDLPQKATVKPGEAGFIAAALMKQIGKVWQIKMHVLGVQIN